MLFLQCTVCNFIKLHLFRFYNINNDENFLCVIKYFFANQPDVFLLEKQKCAIFCSVDSTFILL